MSAEGIANGGVANGGVANGGVANGGVANGGVANGGAIHDIGYRHYDGERLGRGQITWALTLHSLRSAFGIGRGAKAKIVPVLTFVIMCLPAVVNAVAVALSSTHTRLIPYDTYLAPLRTLVMIAFVASQAPELVSRDLRSKIMPLYFARPISRADYPAAKLTAFVLACLAMIEIPLLLLYIGTVSQASGASAIWAQTRALIPGLLLGVAWSVLLAGLGLALASLSGRRAYATGAIAVYFLLTYTLANLLVHVGASGLGPPGSTPSSALARLAGLISPFTVLDGLRQWLGGTTKSVIPNPGGFGPLYGLMFAALLVVGIGGLFLRYRQVAAA
jgi:ABC-2 type transport system permease protein